MIGTRGTRSFCRAKLIVRGLSMTDTESGECFAGASDGSRGDHFVARSLPRAVTGPSGPQLDEVTPPAWE